MVKLKSHQLLPVKFMQNNKGLILFHSTGSGKTLTALFAMYQFDKDIIIIGPKSSKKAFNDNIKKANFNPARFTFYSYKKVKNLVQTNLEIFSGKSVIVDEAHNLRNETTNNLFVISALGLAYKIILLTATPVINYLNDLAVMVNIVKGEDVLPTDKKLFSNMYYDEPSNEPSNAHSSHSAKDDNNFTITNEDILMKKLADCISYYKTSEDNEHYPKHKTEVIEVEMSNEQLQEYVHYVNKIIFKGSMTANDNPYDIDFNVLDKRHKNFFMSSTRQLSNAVNGAISPKIEAIYNKIKQGPYPIVVYSNFLKNGIYPLALLLEKGNITYKSITGDSTDDEVNMVVNNYNNGKYKVLLLSSAGSESLDLKGTRQIHIMEMWWNEPKITQIIGRAIRYKSHDALLEKDRNVMIYRWVSIFPKRILNQSADQYLVELSEKKHKIFSKFTEIIKKVSIERTTKGGHLNEYERYKKMYLQLKTN